MVINARFWVWENGGPVKLTLRPGESLSHCVSGPTDEGHCLEWFTVEHCGDYVSQDYGRDERDCDGRTSSEGSSVCPLDHLAVAVVGDDCPRFPAWAHVATNQRDYAAEAAGY